MENGFKVPLTAAHMEPHMHFLKWYRSPLKAQLDSRINKPPQLLENKLENSFV